MLTELRRDEIVKLVNTTGSVNIRELMERFQASESTIRRDLVDLGRSGSLTKVHGGAISNTTVTADYSVSERESLNKEDKIRIARHAASLINEHDLIYIDASTTTSYMTDYLSHPDISIVTNSISIASELAAKGFQVSIPGGSLKMSSEAVVGEEALSYLEKYNFSSGFFGTNAVSIKSGFSTPEIREASIKRFAMEHCRTTYVLADNAKFGKNSSVTFGDFNSSTIITAGDIPAEFTSCANIIFVP